MPNTVFTFEVEEIQELRERAADAWMEQLPEDTPEGWSRSPIDLTAFVAAFPPLQLKQGFVLRAYQFRQGNNGNAVVWAVPGDLAFPEPDECPTSDPPRPPGALDDVMEAIEGDQSPRSYLFASLFAREAAEIGAAGHGAKWDAYLILGGDPWLDEEQPTYTSPYQGPTGAQDEWEWAEPKPSEWSPMVRTDGNTAVVAFYTFCGLGFQRITRHTDTYTPGRYCFETGEQVIARGLGGYVW